MGQSPTKAALDWRTKAIELNPRSMSCYRDVTTAIDSPSFFSTDLRFRTR